MLTFPRDLVLEMYLGRWVEVTALPEGRSLRQVDPVTVSWGLPGEQARALAPPNTVEGVLNNDGGHWTPGNPLSDYYDYLQGRNVPTRLGLRVSRDAFGRTLPTTWGTTDTGDAWAQTAGTFSVGSGVGVMTVAAANSYQLAVLGEDYGDCQVAATASWNLNVAGGAVEPLNLVLRYQVAGTFAGEHYLLRVSVSPAEVLTASIHSSVFGLLSSTVTVATLTPGANSYRAKFQAEGQTLRGKVYAAGPAGDPDANEPLGWQVSAHHERLTTGRPGVRTGVATGNTNVPVTVNYDDWVLTLLRHTGELTRLQPTWDPSHRFKTARFKAAGVTQRLGRPQRPALSSAPRRYLPTTSPLAYWPCDDGVLSEAVKPLVGTTPVSMVGDTTGGVIALTELAPWLGTGITTNPGASFAIRCFITGSSSSAWCSDLLIRPNTANPSAGSGPYVVTTDVSVWQVFVDLSAGTLAMRLNPSGGVQVTLGTSAVLPQLTDGKVHHLRWRTSQNGANIDWFVYLDGVLVLSGSRAAMTNTAMVELFLGFLAATYGHLAPYSGAGPSLAASVAACFGHVGERAVTRASRLCTEEAVPFDYWGNPAASVAMGPQYPVPLTDQLAECAEADGAVVFEPRYTAGVAFRGRRSMCGRAAGATLSYSAGMVAPEFATSADDRPTANLVRAEHLGGGFVVVEQTSGPMNTKEPGTDSEAAGRSPAGVTVNVESDAQLGDVAGWARALGTVPEVRFPKVSVNLRAAELNDAAGLVAARDLLNLHVGDRLLVTGMAAADVYRDLDQLARGGTETYRSVWQHALTLNTAPYEKYRSAIYGDAASRYDGANLVTTLAVALTTTTTGARTIETTSGPLWTTNAAAYPMDVLIGGEVVTVSGITSPGGPTQQVMTISARSVNGVVKAHPAGTRVRPLRPSYYA